MIERGGFCDAVLPPRSFDSEHFDAKPGHQTFWRRELAPDVLVRLDEVSFGYFELGQVRCG